MGLTRLSPSEQRWLAAVLVGLAVLVTFAFTVWHAYAGHWLVAAFLLVFVAAGAAVTVTVVWASSVPRWAMIAGMAIAYAMLIASTAVMGPVLLYWGHPLVILTYFLLGSRYGTWVAVPGIAGLVAVAGSVVTPYEFVRVGATLVVTAVFSVIFAHCVERQRQGLEARAVEDWLTGLANRRRFMEEVERAVRAYARHSYPASLLVIDVDHFKSINDRYGHDTGDQVLIDLAGEMARYLRATDRAFRTGGEEFAVLLNGTGRHDAPKAAERLLRLIGGRRFAGPGTVTLSIGVATLAAGETASEWLRRGDDAMYAAKAQGRCGYVLAGDGLSSSAGEASVG